MKKKIALICVILIVFGLICGGAGYALGGIDGIDKLSEKHSWIRTSPGEREVTAQKVGAFRAVDVEGDFDVFLTTKECFEDVSWQRSRDLLKSDEIGKAEEGSVIVIKGSKVQDPVITNEAGVLKIQTKKEKNSGVNINLSDVNWEPRILICCTEDELEIITSKVDTGDTVLDGISYKTVSLQTDTGDIVMKDVTGAGQTISSDTGDVVLAGVFTGTSEIEVDTGDVSFSCQTPLKDMNMDLKTGTGDIVIAEGGNVVRETDSVPASYTQTGGGSKLTVTSDTGDITVSCGMK